MTMVVTTAAVLEDAGRELLNLARDIREHRVTSPEILQRTLQACCEAQGALTMGCVCDEPPPPPTPYYEIAIS